MGSQQLRHALDRSERMRVELRDSLALMAAALESTTDGIIVADASGAVIRWNQRTAAIWELPPGARDQRLGLLDLLREGLGDATRLERRVAELALDPRQESFDVLRAADGRTIEAYSMPECIGDAVVGRVWSFRDVSAREALEARLRQAQRVEAVGLLAGGIAHDLNNLLTIIGASADFLAESCAAGSQQQQADVQEILHAYDRGARLTAQLLAFSRKTVQRPRHIDVGEVVTGLQPMLSRLIGEDITLDTRVAAALGRVKHDEGQLEQAVINLVVNARDAMPDGGLIRIDATEVEIRDPRVRVLDGVLLPGSYIRIDVADSGSGIPPEVLDRIFDPFFSTKGPGRGTGLGLATVRGIVRQAGGHLSVTTAVGVGTTFTIYLPVASGADEGPQSGPSVLPRAFTGSETILVAEDEPSVRLLMQRALARHGYRVLVARDGEEAIVTAAMHEGPIHLLVTDVVMPGMRGPELAKALQVLRPGLGVLFVSGYTADELGRRGHDPASSMLLPKPFTPRQLGRAVWMALHEPHPR